jgi:hypothetical protein
MEAILSSETSVQFTIYTGRHIPEDGILHGHRRENLKSYRNHGIDGLGPDNWIKEVAWET